MNVQYSVFGVCHGRLAAPRHGCCSFSHLKVAGKRPAPAHSEDALTAASAEFSRGFNLAVMGLEALVAPSQCIILVLVCLCLFVDQ